MTALILTANLTSLALCLVLFLTGHAGRWKSLFCYLYVVPIQGAWDATAVYACNAGGTAWALTGHYCLEALLYACQIWILVEIAQHGAGVTPWLRSSLGKFVRRLCAVGLVVWLTFEMLQGEQRPITLVMVVTHVQRGISLALPWAAAIIVVPLFRFIGASQEIRWISAGLGIQIYAGTITSLLVQILGDSASLGMINACIWCVGLIPFAALLSCKNPSPLLLHEVKGHA